MFLKVFISPFDFIWTLVQATMLVILILIIRKYHILPQTVAKNGFYLLFVVIILSMFKLDDYAGILAEFAWICFAVSLVQQFAYFIKTENKLIKKE